MKKALIFGASTGLGKSMGYVLSEKGYDLILSASDTSEIAKNASDMKIRYSNEIDYISLDLFRADDIKIEEYIKKCFSIHSDLSTLIITSGLNDPEDNKDISNDIIEKLVNVNYLSVIKLINLFLKHINLNSHLEFRIVVCSSIATSRNREKNNIYASAKLALEAYCEGIQHAYSKHSNLAIQVYRLGYIDSPKSYGQKLLFPPLDPKIISKKIFSNLSKPYRRFFYLPHYWFYIVKILQLLPWFIYKKLNF